MNYSKKDVELLALTILTDHEDYSDNSGSCRYCFVNHFSTNVKKLEDGSPHTLDCPTFVAQDVLTVA